MSTEDRIDVSSLADSYDIIAELGGGDSTRSYIAKRRADGKDVVITVARTPAGDERHALTHLAADVNLLATLRHRHLVPVLEGRWLGTGAFAVVSERVFAPTAEELLGRGERFSNARIAAILREVNGILDWARRERVVHRAVTTDTIFLEPGTDRALVAFAIRPIPLTGAPEAEGDARTVATIARTMLARSAEETGGGKHPEEQLAELRPDLPQRVIARTEELLNPTRGGPAPDVPGYLAMIAMADAVKVGEEESARVTAQAHEEERLTKAQLEAERQEQERQLADERQRLAEERAELERQIAADREALLAERTELERTMAEERQRLARQRAELTSAITAAHEQLSLEREALERQRLAAFERGAQPGGRPSFDRLRELARRREPTPGLADRREPESGRADGSELERPVVADREVAPVFVPAADASTAEPPAGDELFAGRAPETREEERATAADGPRKSWRDHRAWAIPVGVVTVLGIVIASALALAGGGGVPAVAITTGTSIAAESTAGLAAMVDSAKLVVDSSAGSVAGAAPTAVASAAPAAPAAAPASDSATAASTPSTGAAVDSAAADSARADSVRAAARRAAARRREQERQRAAQVARDSARRDSAAAIDPFALPPAPLTSRPPATPTRARADSTRRDTTVRRDSVPPAGPNPAPPA